MKSKALKIFLLLVFLPNILFFSSCKKDKKEEETVETDTVETQISKPAVNQEALDEIINSFPSPVQMSALIKSLNIPFSKRYLLDPNKTEDYDTNNKKAFALGVLSADLGYLNIYERSTLIVEYLSSIKRLADQLRVGQFFDFQALKRMATNNDLTTLIITSVNNFFAMHQHLSATGRSNLSLLMITGVWTEGLYLLAVVTEDSKKFKDNPDFQDKYEELKEKIGEQKILFDELYKVLLMFKDDPYFATLIDNFKELKSIYDGVEIQIIEGENQIDTTGGEYVISQGDESKVIITDEQAEAIITTIQKVRNKLINL